MIKKLIKTNTSDHFVVVPCGVGHFKVLCASSKCFLQKLSIFRINEKMETKNDFNFNRAKKPIKIWKFRHHKGVKYQPQFRKNLIVIKHYPLPLFVHIVFGNGCCWWETLKLRNQCKKVKEKRDKIVIILLKI